MAGTQVDAVGMVECMMSALGGMPPYLVKMMNVAADLIIEQQRQIGLREKAYIDLFDKSEKQQATIEDLEKSYKQIEKFWQAACLAVEVLVPENERLTAQLKAAREWKEIAEGLVAHFKSCADCWECLIESDPAIAKRYDRAALESEGT